MTDQGAIDEQGGVRMAVRINEAGEDELALRINHLCAFGRPEGGIDSLG